MTFKHERYVVIEEFNCEFKFKILNASRVVQSMINRIVHAGYQGT